MRTNIAALVATAFLISAASATAEKTKDEEAQNQFSSGVELYDEGKFDQAAISFARAYELKPSYKLLYNIAQTENQLGHYTEALEAYRKYLEDGGDKIDEERRTQIEGEVERLLTLVGTIAVTGDSDGASIFIDNRAVGNTPLPGPVMVDVGEHEVLVKQDGREVHREVVKVAGGEEVPVEWITPTEKEEPAEAPRRLWTWVSLGVAGAAGIAGGVIGGVALSSKNDIEDNYCFDNHCLENQRDERDRVENLALTADILYGVAGAAAAAAIVLFFVEPGLGEEEEPVAAVPIITEDTAGLAITGRF